MDSSGICRCCSRTDVFTGAVLCWGLAGAVREGGCRDRGGLGGGLDIIEVRNRTLAFTKWVIRYSQKMPLFSDRATSKKYRTCFLRTLFKRYRSGFNL